ncbi:E3 ubiquitin-protein ligase RNF12-like [Lytechinus pictus]|uniref:E3 ubiquitin-protein ligase RNF12-like n=1 Tax=Lytechinus pictus TaxID=7653 RepID=UPI0030BA1AC3
MPFRRVQVSQKPRDAVSRRSSHSPLRQSAMGNRQLTPSAPPGRGKNSLLNKPTRKNVLHVNRAVGDGGFQKKSSSGAVTTVGTTGMIPFQRASRREPHVEPQATEVSKKLVSKKNDVSHRQSLEQQDSGTSNLTNSKERSSASTSDSKTLQSGGSNTRSVRPKLKRPSVPKDQIKTSRSSQKTSNHTGAINVDSGANGRNPSEVELVNVTSTSPRRRIVRRKSQTTAAERKNDNDDVHLASSINENERTNDVSLSSFEVNGVEDDQLDIVSLSLDVGNSPNNNIPVPRTVSQPSDENLPERTVRNNASEHSEETPRLDNRRPLSRSQPLNQTLPEGYHRPGTARQTSNEESENNLRRQTELPSEMLPRPLSQFETGRPTFQPATAIATDFHESSQVTSGQDRQPNSVRRSLERLGTGSERSITGERSRLARQSALGLSSRGRPREMIDVNSAVSELTTTVPQSPRTQPGRVGRNSRLEASTASTEEDVWVPRLRPDSGDSTSPLHDQNPNSSTQLPFSSEASSVHHGRSESPNVVFRDSPVTGLLHRRHSRLSSSENETYPSVRNTTRNAPTVPSRSGLYRALSLNNDNTSASESNASEITTTIIPSQNQRGTRTNSRIGNIDNDDVASWRQIEREHSYPSREPRQRLIYQDRNRGHETILNRNTSGHRIVPPSIDSFPDISDEQEFPPLGNPASPAGAFRNGSGQVQTSQGSGSDYGFTARNRRSETPPPTPTPGRDPPEERLTGDDPMPMVDHLVLLASPIFGPLMLQASPAVLFNMLSRARRDFGGEFVELLIENVVLNLLAQHTFDGANQTQNNNGAPPPASQETIESLEKVTVTKQMVSDDAFCSICHCEYMMDEVLDQLPCKHNFHNHCITVWLKKSGTCPVCRHKLYTDSVD